MSKPLTSKPQGYRVAWIAAAIGLAVVGIATRETVVKLSNDDCTSITTTLANDTRQTVQTCS